MSTQLISHSTRLSAKDNFNSNREMNMSEFLKKINNESNDLYEKSNHQSSQNVQSTSISDIPQKSNMNNIDSGNSIFDYPQISKQKHIPQYTELSSNQFNKIVNQKVDTFENFRIPQATTQINKEYQQIPAKISKIDTHDKKLHSTEMISDNSLKTQTVSPIFSEKLSVTEIRNKRRLSSTIYQSLMRTYKNIGQHFISQLEIEQLLDRQQLNGKDDKAKIKEFVTLLKIMITNNMNITEQTSDLQISDERPFEKGTKENIYNLLLDTKDRNKGTYPIISHFGFFFQGHNIFSKDKENVGYINRNFNNVKCAELTEVIIPRETENGDKYELYPYLLIDIEEFGNIFEGTNESLSNAFGKISFGKVIGNYAYYNAPKDNQLKKHFNTPISLSKITVRVKKPNGDLFNFGKYISDQSNKMKFVNNPSSEENINKDELVDKVQQSSNLTQRIESNITLLFKISCLQRSIDTTF